MSKFIIFSLLWWLVGNPFLALLLLLIIIYVLDRQFIGILPSLTRPLKRRREAARLRDQIALNPNDVSAKLDLARNLISRKKYEESLRYLDEIKHSYDDSADYWNAVGTSEVMVGQTDQGEAHLLKALSLNPRVQYGEPWLRLADAYKNKDQSKALGYLEQFQSIQSSSCEGYYLSGTIYQSLDKSHEAHEAFTQSLAIYRSLPKYRKKSERKWALRSWVNKMKK